MFAEPDRNDENADNVLAATLRDGRVVLGYGLTFGTAPAGSHDCALQPFSAARRFHPAARTPARDRERRHAPLSTPSSAWRRSSMRCRRSRSPNPFPPE
jgi:hypothetical protein